MLAGRLSELESELRASLNAAEEQARSVGAHIVMVGMLPTLTPDHLTGEALSANPRYRLINEQIFAARGEDLYIHIDGPERLATHADTIAPEAACTSVQFHLQVSPQDYAGTWNAAQCIAGVQLALGANSPFLFGKELWRETRVALFEQATDTRPQELKPQGVRPRVWFGERWITSVFDQFEENVRYFPALLPVCDDEDPAAVLDRGGTPHAGRAADAQRHDLPVEPSGLRRLPRHAAPARREPGAARRADRRRHDGQRCVLLTACYGHWPSSERPLWSQMSFQRRRGQLRRRRAARHRRALFWPGLGEVPATELVLRRLLPMAHEGLAAGASTQRSPTGCSA